MEQNKIFDIIIYLLEGIKNKKPNNALQNKFGEETLEITNCSYLLNQLIRQYSIPQNHYFISEKALAMWKEINTDNILNYRHRDKVTKVIDGETEIEKYKGNEKSPTKALIKKGDFFIYNDVFTDEHIVPVSVIIKELCCLEKLDYKSIKVVLDKIYICKMLKAEDRGIANKYNRSSNYEEVIKEDYKKIAVKQVK